MDCFRAVLYGCFLLLWKYNQSRISRPLLQISEVCRTDSFINISVIIALSSTFLYELYIDPKFLYLLAGLKSALEFFWAGVAPPY